MRKKRMMSVREQLVDANATHEKNIERLMGEISHDLRLKTLVGGAVVLGGIAVVSLFKQRLLGGSKADMVQTHEQPQKGHTKRSKKSTLISRLGKITFALGMTLSKKLLRDYLAQSRYNLESRKRSNMHDTHLTEN